LALAMAAMFIGTFICGHFSARAVFDNATVNVDLSSFERQSYDFEPYGTTTLTAGRAPSSLFLPDLQIAGVFFRSDCAQAVTCGLYKVAVAVMRTGPVPRHIGFIMDGNRRWAKQHGLQTLEGHNLGYRSMVNVLEHCKELGVEVVTVYAFSIENFKRSQTEVNYLMELAMGKFEEAVSRQGELHRHRVRVRVLGDLSLLSGAVQQACARVMRATSENDGPLLNVCLSYTSREEIGSTVAALVDGVRRGELEADDLDVSLIGRCLYTVSFFFARSASRRHTSSR
jgi:undecaprenyl diphosphate synthase